jgi:hypothetical protein
VFLFDSCQALGGSFDPLYHGFQSSRNWKITSGTVLPYEKFQTIPRVEYSPPSESHEETPIQVKHISYKYYGISKNQMNQLNLREKYKEGTTTLVYFDPKNPSRSVLETGIGYKGIESLCLPVSILLLPIPKIGLFISPISFISLFLVGQVSSWIQFKKNKTF